MPGLEEDEFVLASRDLAAGQGQPFMRMSDPMFELESAKFSSPFSLDFA